VADTFFCTSLGKAYPNLLEYVLEAGRVVPSRIGETREVLDLQLAIDCPSECLVGRAGMSDAFAYEEILQLLAGRYNGERLAAVVPLAAELITSPTAYGPRTAEQLQHVARELEENPNSRRAVVYVGRHDDLAILRSPVQAEARAGEMPCTALWQFHLRHGVLNMAVYMRSWDLVWGLSYDVPSFVAVQTVLARHLGVAVGEYVHTAGSAHVYERHYGVKTWPREDALDLSHVLRDTVQETQARAAELMSVAEDTERDGSRGKE
jgi:thymidylate synthase